MRYNTKQREYLLDFFKENDKEYPASFVIDSLKEKGLKISKATFYRTIDELVSQKEIRCFYDNDRKCTFYQNAFRREDCNHHLHLKCMQCGALFHLDCGMVSTLVTHIQNEHKFQIDYNSSIIYGLCSECRELVIK